MSQQGADLVGRTLGRTYQVERLLGGGGMGAVWAARHVRTGGLFAVKILHSETAADSDIYKRFQDEARTVSALRHPHIVQVTDFDQDDDGTPFIVMELLEGEDLYQRLCRVGKLSVEQVLDIGRQVGSALHAAHEKGIIHRDIKPQNIFLVRHEVADMVTEVAKVVDFGISKIRRTGPQMTRDMTILGTPQFMSPEAALGQNSQLDGRADQWSLAVIMYLSLTGRLPFDGDNLVGVLYMVVHEQPVRLKLLCPEVPDAMLVAIERAMAKKKEDRYPRMVDFVRAMTGLGVTNAASVRMASLQMPSARAGAPEGDVNATQHLMPPAVVSPDARTAVPHLLGNLPHAQSPAAAPWNPGAAPQPSPTPPQPTQLNSSDAVTKAPHLALGAVGELPPTRPAVLVKELTPLTVPLGQPPELVATPTAPTSFSPLATGSLPVTRPAVRPSGPSGNTPTNIALTDMDLQALMSGAETTPDPREPVEDLLGVPTRVVMSSPTSGDDQTIARYQVPAGPTNATMPLGHLIRPYSPDSPYDPANPNTLSHATGQEVSLRPRLLPKFPKLPPLPPLPSWPVVREGVFKLIGVLPRSSVRLAVTGGVLTLLVALIVIWLVSGPSPPPPTEGHTKTSGVATAAGDALDRDAALAGLLTDGGTAPGLAAAKDPKLTPTVATHPVGSEEKPAIKPIPGKAGKAGSGHKGAGKGAGKH